MATRQPTVDREKSTERMRRDIETLAGPSYTRSNEAIRRYAYTPEYRNTLDYLVRGKVIVENNELVGSPGDGRFVRRARFGEQLTGAGASAGGS